MSLPHQQQQQQQQHNTTTPGATNNNTGSSSSSNIGNPNPNNTTNTTNMNTTNTNHYRSPFLSPLTPPFPIHSSHHVHGFGGGGGGRRTIASTTTPTAQQQQQHHYHHHPYSSPTAAMTSISFRGNTTTTSSGISGTNGPSFPTPRYNNNNNNNSTMTNHTPVFTESNTTAVVEQQQVQEQLQMAVTILQQRQLKCAAKFMAELQLGFVGDQHHGSEGVMMMTNHVHPNDNAINTTNDDDDNEEEEEETVPENIDKATTTTTNTISEDLFLPTTYTHPTASSSNHTTTKPHGTTGSSSTSTSTIQYPALFQYARTLLDMGDYAHAASILSIPSNSVTSSATGTSATTTTTSKPFVLFQQSSSSITPTIELPPPPSRYTTSSSSSSTTTTSSSSLPHLSTHEIYVRSYALYMAGEQQKEEQMMEYQSEGQSSMICRNPYISDLLPELHVAYISQRLDAFGLYVYGMVLSQSSAALSTTTPTAHSILIDSILQFPYNWSAWLDLASLIIGTTSMMTSESTTNTTTTTTSRIEQEIEERVQPILGEHYMYHLFCAHVFVERHNYYDAMMIYEQWMDITMFSAAPYLRSQYALCCYHLRNYTTAKIVLQELHTTLPYRLDAMDIYSNVLYVLEDSFALSQLAHVAVGVDKYRAETCCIIGNYYSMKKQRAKAIQQFQRALLLDRTFTSAYTLIGHEYVEWKQTANAMESYRKAVQISPRDYRAWYGLGQTYELLNMNLHALYYYKQATQLRPYDALMWCALGSTFSQIQRPTDAIKSYERALQHNPQEHFATQKLATLYHNNQQMEDAAQCYMRHLELLYSSIHPNDNPDPNSTNYSNSTTTNRLETMLQGISIETIEAEAIMYLAIYYRKNNDFESAAIFCSRLLDYPGPEREQAKAMLRELRSRGKSFKEIFSGNGNTFSTTDTSRTTSIHTRSKGPVNDNSFLG